MTPNMMERYPDGNPVPSGQSQYTSEWGKQHNTQDGAPNPQIMYTFRQQTQREDGGKS